MSSDDDSDNQGWKAVWSDEEDEEETPPVPLHQSICYQHSDENGEVLEEVRRM